MPENTYEDESDEVPSTRVARLLRERELRRSNRGLEISDHDLPERSPNVEQNPEGPNEGPIRQRLLVVANRLPVSAVRSGEDSWSLEISAGGLVSALLGVYCTYHCHSILAF